MKCGAGIALYHKAFMDKTIGKNAASAMMIIDVPAVMAAFRSFDNAFTGVTIR